MAGQGWHGGRMPRGVALAGVKGFDVVGVGSGEHGRAFWTCHAIAVSELPKCLIDVRTERIRGAPGAALRIQADGSSRRPSSSTMALRIMNFWALPVTVIGSSGTKRT